MIRTAGLVQQHALGRIDVTCSDEDDLTGVEPGAVPAVPQAARTRQRHTAEVTRPGGLRGVEVPVRVDPQHEAVRVFSRHHGQAGEAGRAGVGDHHRAVVGRDARRHRLSQRGEGFPGGGQADAPVVVHRSAGPADVLPLAS